MNAGTYAGLGLSTGASNPNWPAIGENITLTHSANQVVIDGKVFLRAGVLDTAAGYQSSLAINPGLGVIVSNAPYAAPNQNRTSHRPMVWGGSTGAYVHQQITTDGTEMIGQVWYRSSNFAGTFTQVNEAGYFGYTQVYGGTSVGADAYYMLAAESRQGYGYGIMRYSGSSYTGFVASGGAPQYACAAKPDGSAFLSGYYLRSAGNAASGDMMYGTPTPSSIAPDMSGTNYLYTVTFVGWSVCSSRWIVIGQYGRIATAATPGNGTTFTDRGVPTGMPVNICANPGTHWDQNLMQAHSPNSSLFVVKNASSPWDYHLVRTTDGVNFTVTSLASLGLFMATSSESSAASAINVTRLTYFGGAYYLYRDSASTSMVTPSVYKSTDEGLTWTAVTPILFNGYASTYPLTFLGSINANIVALSQPTPTTGIHAILSGLAPTHIGVPNPRSNVYVRVK